MTLEEAMHVANNRLPEEPAEDWLTSWQAARPRPEPVKEPPKLDTAQVDVSRVIGMTLRADRALHSEATGQALGEVRNEVLDEFDAAIEKLRAEFCAEAERLRAEFSQANELRELRVQLAEIKPLLTARSRKAPPAPSSNSDALPL